MQAGCIAVRHHFDRATAAHVQAFASISTGWIVDAQGKRGALSSAIRPISRVHGFCGTAYTVRTRGRDNLAAYAALAQAKAGDVLVIATDEYAEASVVGDVFIGLARNLGVLAVVTDGMVRDVAGIDAVGIPVFAQGLSPNSPYKDGPGELGTEVNIAGLRVVSGDIVRGDADGVVVVPAAQAAQVLSAIERVRTQEAKMDSWVRDGLTQPPWLADAIDSGIFKSID